MKKERVRQIRKTFLELVELKPWERARAGFPKRMCLDTRHANKVSLVVLLRKCAAHKTFAPLPGETSAKDNALATLYDAGLEVVTLASRRVCYQAVRIYGTTNQTTK